VEAYNVPLVPGVNHAVETKEEAIKIASEIGFPVLVKASAGGGGKGMRIIASEKELEQGMKTAISEAKSSFGDGSVFIEKYVEKPRHIEIQILADKHGNVIHLLERECSIQRRHQKLVEEAPSSVLDETLRNAMGEAAINVAKACNYSGAGTVEFLLDAQKNFYFLEMNTRLQVEHPVTELITGHDLVEQQIRVARGEELLIQQDSVHANGHAIELRLCAEDPRQDFLPAVGKLIRYRSPQMDWVRLDDFVYEGYEIPIYYDNMFAKLIVQGRDRKEAIERMKRAIVAFEIEGIPNTLEFGHFVMNHPAFVEGDFDTGFVQNHFSPEAMDALDRDFHEVAALFSYQHLSEMKELTLPLTERSDWRKRSDD
jgi:propionyl-CoA carboxylase alpha chain